jgi:hypothetical protein
MCLLCLPFVVQLLLAPAQGAAGTATVAPQPGSRPDGDGSTPQVHAAVRPR